LGLDGGANATVADVDVVDNIVGRLMAFGAAVKSVGVGRRW